MTTTTTPLTALVLVCSLKPCPAASSSELNAEYVFTHLCERNVAVHLAQTLKSAKYPAYE